jgi:hypothetical protein
MIVIEVACEKSSWIGVRELRQSRTRAAPESERRHKLELDEQEKKSVERSLIERKARLEEACGDTTQKIGARRRGELPLIRAILRRLRSRGCAAGQIEAKDDACDK